MIRHAGRNQSATSQLAGWGFCVQVTCTGILADGRKGIDPFAARAWNSDSRRPGQEILSTNPRGDTIGGSLLCIEGPTC
jgi:hypothetical protein